MATASDILSVVGTWLAAAVAVIALLSIIGPIRAYWTDHKRHNAKIDAIDDPAGELTGNHFFSGTRQRGLLPKGCFPDLSRPLNLHGVESTWVRAVLEQKTSTTSWLMFCRMLKVYGIPVPTREWLPDRGSNITEIAIHQTWILAFGMLGRYGVRKDQGRKVERLAGRIDHRDVEVDHVARQAGIELPMLLDVRTSTDDAFTLHGTSGRLQYKPDKNDTCIYYKPHDHVSRSQSAPDTTPFETLFWIALSCIRIDDHRVFDFGLETQRVEYRSRHYYEGREIGEREEYFRAYRLRRIDDLEESSCNIRWAKHLCNWSAGIWSWTPAQISEDMERLSLAHPFREDSSVWRLHEYRHDPSYGLGDSQFVYLWKVDLYLLTLAMIKMQPNILGILYSHEYGAFFKACFSHSDPVSHLEDLYRIIIDPEGFTNIAGYQDLCDPEMPTEYGRSRLKMLHALDLDLGRRRKIGGATRLSGDVREAIQVLYLTSNLFRWSLRKWAEAGNCTKTDKCLALDYDSKCFRILAPFTHSHDIGFDFGEVFGETNDIPKKVLKLELGDVLLDCLQAWVRQKAFFSSINSSPLLRLVEVLPEVTYLPERPCPSTDHAKWLRQAYYKIDPGLKYTDGIDMMRRDGMEHLPPPDEWLSKARRPTQAEAMPGRHSPQFRRGLSSQASSGYLSRDRREASRSKEIKECFVRIRTMEPWGDIALRVHLDSVEERLLADLWSLQTFSETMDEHLREWFFPEGLVQDLRRTMTAAKNERAEKQAAKVAGGGRR